MYGVVSFYEALRSQGIKPIIGYEAFVASGSRFDRTLAASAGERPFYNLVLLARDLEGYQNLVQLSSRAFTEGLHHKPRVDIDLLSQYSAGLTALSGGVRGAVGHFLAQGNEQKAREAAEQLAEIFQNNFFIEISDHGIDPNRRSIMAAAALANDLEVPLVATNDVHYLLPEDALAHEVLLCIGDGRTLDPRGSLTFGSDGFFLRSAEEMWSLFGNEFPEALTNTVAIAEQCDVDLRIGDANLTLPQFPIPTDSGCTTVDGYLEKVVNEGYELREREVWAPMRSAGTLKHSAEEYRQRLAREIEVIEKMGYSGYFLIVWDFIKYAVNRGIPVGPGRGSAAGSLVAYVLGITGVDPLEYDLLFERFLNPERVSMPDIDVDFCIRGRADVIDHVTRLYGRESVCQIITFGTMASRAAIKDVGRALSMPYGDVEKVAKLIPPPVRGRNVSISQALEQVQELKAAVRNNEAVRDLVGLALKLEGCSRHSSVHAAGVVISPKPLHELVPIAVSAKGELTSQYSMNDLEKVGMLKMDFLALTTLTVLNDCILALKEKAGVDIDWATIPLDDEKTMAIFGEGRTDAVFQFESDGMQEICRRMKPKGLEDLSALNALYRPGPIDGGMIEDFIARHRGEKRVQYLIPEMKETLSNTFGVLVYQEQIMQLAQRLAGYTLGEADVMRRAMGKKKREAMAKEEKRFIAGAVANGIDKGKAEAIFKLMAQFADYGFNRSHSIAYAYLAFQTAYLKAHYPAFFYAAVLSHESDDSAKVYKYSVELRAMGLELLPPDVNESDEGFTPTRDSVRFGLGAIKGLGHASIAAIIAAREDRRFVSLFDFVSRVDPSAIGRRGLEALVTAGAFDTLMPETSSVNEWRARLYSSIEGALAIGQKAFNDRKTGQHGLFGGGTEAEQGVAGELAEAEPWTQAELSAYEKRAVGFYLSAHPLDDHEELLESCGIVDLADRPPISAGDEIALAGIVSASQVRYSKKGNRFCVFRLEDRSAGVKCLVWAEAYTKSASLIHDDELVIVEGRVETVEGPEITVIVNSVRALEDALPEKARSVTIRLPEGCGETGLFEIFSVLGGSVGTCDVFLDVPVRDLDVRLYAAPFRVKGSRRLQRELADSKCEVEWRL
jgi:DNA polymerase-3 subunit alpha